MAKWNKFLWILILVGVIYLWYQHDMQEKKKSKRSHSKDDITDLKSILKSDSPSDSSSSKSKKKVKFDLPEEEQEVELDTEIDPDLLEIAYQKPNAEQEKKYAFLDIAVDSTPVGRITLELENGIVPRTVKNFLHLCKNKYPGSKFHRVVPDFAIQAGDFTNGDGTGGYSIYGNTFEDENFVLKHNQPGVIAMANSGPNTNGSQFYITANRADELDDSYVVFGKVMEGMHVVNMIFSTPTDNKERPLRSIEITNSGELLK